MLEAAELLQRQHKVSLAPRGHRALDDLLTHDPALLDDAHVHRHLRVDYVCVCVIK